MIWCIYMTTNLRLPEKLAHPSSFQSAPFCLCYHVISCLATSKVRSRQVPTCDNAHSWRLFSAAPHKKPCHQHHDLISHSGTLSWKWANQSLSYPNNAQRLTMKWQVPILKRVVPLDQSSRWGFHNRPTWETDALLIWLSRLACIPGDNWKVVILSDSKNCYELV